MTTPTVETSDRQRRLEGRVRRLRTRAASGGLDRWLLVIGGTLIPLGLLLIVLGWLGAARTPLVFEQIPYLISGGQLGVALVFSGGFVYFAYWQTVRIRDSRQQQKAMIDSLARIESLLAAGVAVSSAVTRTTNGETTGGNRLVSTPNGTMFHRPDCPVVTGREGLRIVDGTEAGMRPCLICNPLAVLSN